ncbi:MAG: ATP-binding protein [Candidatus Kapaibacterium sp.]
MKNQDNLFLWKAQLLEKIYRFAIYFGFLTLVVSGTLTIMKGAYLQASLYFLVYGIAVYGGLSKRISYTAKVNTLILMTSAISLIVYLLEGDLTIGMVWTVYSVFFAVTFLPKWKYKVVIYISAAIVLLWYVNFLMHWIIPNRPTSDIYYYIKFTNSIAFLIAGILYINERLIQSIASSLLSEKSARKELKKEKKNIEETNKTLENKLAEIDSLKSQLESANLTLSVRVEEQKIGIKETMSDLRTEIVNHKNTEEELLKTREELILSLDKEKALNEMKSKFISMISHEYRTPLTVLMNSTYLLDKYFELNEKKKFDDSLSKINHSVVSMTDLLEEVIRFGHSDLDEVGNDIEEIDLVHQVSTLITNFKNQEKKKFNVIIDYSENPMLIRTDARKVRLILNNLIKNAIHYSGETPEITIILERMNQLVRVSVMDKGIGITENDIDKIFEPFYRGENTIGNSGTGLGLAISKRYAESLDGHINYDSQIGKGSNFTLVLPINKH